MSNSLVAPLNIGLYSFIVAALNSILSFQFWPTLNCVQIIKGGCNV